MAFVSIKNPIKSRQNYHFPQFEFIHFSFLFIRIFSPIDSKYNDDR